MKKLIDRQKISEKIFDDYRNKISEEFASEKMLYKHKLTQGLYWSDFDNNLANQFVREEAWLLGIKVKDNVKFIDHCFNADEMNKKKIGF